MRGPRTVGSSGDAESEAVATEGVQRSRPTLTNKVIFVVCCINFIDCLNATQLVPYVDAMVADILGKERGDPDIANWVSLLVGSYSVCEVFFSGLWGSLSDRIGRRRVLLVGLVGSIVAPVLFGLTTSLPWALAARLLDGLFCGNVGVTRTYLGEVTDASNEARAFGILSSAFSVGLFVGPAMGGLLVHPERWAPGLFSGTIFEHRPYLLPNVAVAVFGLAALAVGAGALEETRPPGPPRGRPAAAPRGDAARGLLPQSGAGSTPEASATVPAPAPAKLWTRSFVQLLLIMALLYGYVAARLQSFVLITSFPRSRNGLALGPTAFGYIQMCAASTQMLTQLFIYGPVIERLGPHRSFIAGMSWTLLITLPFPLYCEAGVTGSGSVWGYVPIALWQSLSQIGFQFCFSVVFILLNRDCDPARRGAANGWANSIGALTRGLAPEAAGALVTAGGRAEKAGFAGGRYVGLYLNLLVGAAAALLQRRRLRATAACGPPAAASVCA